MTPTRPPAPRLTQQQIRRVVVIQFAIARLRLELARLLHPN